MSCLCTLKESCSSCDTLSARPVAQVYHAEVNAADMYALLCGTVRYSLGRTSYVVGETDVLVRKYAHLLDAGMMRVIHKSIIRHGELGYGYGSDDDQRTWTNLAAFLEEAIAKR